jgi:hypothetical protein
MVTVAPPMPCGGTIPLPGGKPGGGEIPPNDCDVDGGVVVVDVDGAVEIAAIVVVVVLNVVGGAAVEAIKAVIVHVAIDVVPVVGGVVVSAAVVDMFFVAIALFRTVVDFFIG